MRVHKLVVIETLQGLGIPGLAGAALLVAGLVYGLAMVLPSHQQAGRTRAQAERAEARLAQIKSGQELVPDTPAGQLDAFYRAVPAQPAATEWINRIYVAAEGEELSLSRAEYALTVDPATRLARYQIVLPVRGEYGQIRRFIADALNEVPSLGLEDINFQRQTIADTQVEARIRMTLYLTRP